MALSGQLLRVLNNDDEPLPKRLKIADNAFKSVDLPIQYREIFLLKWLSQLKHANDVNIWSQFHAWISSEQMKDLSRNDINHEDILFITEIIIDKLNETEDGAVKRVIIQITLLLLENKVFQQYYKYNLKKYFNFVANIICNVDDVSVLVSFVKSDFIFHKSYLSEEKFLKYFMDFITGSLSDVLIKLDDDALFQAASKLLEKCIFQKNFKNFENYYKSCFDQPENDEEAHSTPKILMRKLKSIYELEITKSKCVYKLLFDAYCKSYTNDFLMVYKFSVILMENFGFGMSQSFKLSNNEKFFNPTTELPKSLSVLSEIFETLSRNKGSTDAKINDTGFADFLQNVIKSIISLTTQASPQIYKIIKHAISINPLLVEPLISEILVYVMFSNNSYFKKDYEELLVSIFEVFLKLHRVQNLISKMIPAVKYKIKSGQEVKSENAAYGFNGVINEYKIENRAFSVQEMLPERVLSYFTHCISTLASWQVMNLFKTLLFHLDRYVEEDIKTKEKTQLLYVEIVSTLMCQLLASVRMAEHNVPSVVIAKFVQAMEQLKAILTKFGSCLVSMEHNQTLMGAFLNICYNWAELYVALTYYSINHEVAMQKNTDNDFSACNITYLHSYLTTEQWCLISQRITNFGEKPCIQIMHKLLLQKIKAMHIFEQDVNEEVFGSVIKELSLNLDDNWDLLIAETFSVRSVIPQFEHDQITAIADFMVHDVLENGNFKILKSPAVSDSNLLTQAILFSCLTKLNKNIKQKKKHDETDTAELLSSKILARVTKQDFLNVDEDYEANLDEIIATFNDEIESATKNCEGKALKIKESKCLQCLNLVKILPVIYTSKYVKTVLFTYFSSVLFDTNFTSNEDFRTQIEDIVIGIIQHGSLSIKVVTKPSVIIQFATNHTKRYQEIFTNVIELLFKNEICVGHFLPGVSYLKKNLKDEKCLKCALIVLHTINKYKKYNFSQDYKSSLSEYKSKLCNGLLKLIMEDSDDKTSLIEAYAIVLRNCLAPDDKETLMFENLLPFLEAYISAAIPLMKTGEIKGGLLLFLTILSYKSKQDNIEDHFMLKIWEVCKNLKISEKEKAVYSKLIALIFERISVEQFSKITDDLLKLTVAPLLEEQFALFSKQMEVWNYILQCSFNPTKNQIWQNSLQKLLQQLVLCPTGNKGSYYEATYKDIYKFEINVLHKTQLPLTASIVDTSLISISTIINNTENFATAFKHCVSILEALLQHRKPFVTDRLPSFLQQYRNLLKKLCKESDADLKLNPVQIQQVSDCAHQFEKLTTNVVGCGKHVARISPYLIADILQQYEHVTLYPNMKIHLNNCLYSLISLCDQHAVSYLLRILSTASTEIFKIMYENYKKYYRFTGKV